MRPARYGTDIVITTDAPGGSYPFGPNVGPAVVLIGGMNTVPQGTPTSWEGGTWESAGGNQLRQFCPTPLVVLPEHVKPGLMVEWDYCGHFDNQSNGAGAAESVTISFGLRFTSVVQDGEDVAVQTGNTPANTNVLVHQVTVTSDTAPTTKGRLWWHGKALLTLAKVTDFTTGSMQAVMQSISEVDYAINVTDGGFAAANIATSSRCMNSAHVPDGSSFAGLTMANGFRLTPFIKKGTTNNTRIVMGAGIIRLVPELNNPSTSLYGARL